MTTPRAGAQGSLAVGPVDEEGTGPIPDGLGITAHAGQAVLGGPNRAEPQSAPSPVPAPSLRLPRGNGTEADHDVPAVSAVLTTARPAASHSIEGRAS